MFKYVQQVDYMVRDREEMVAFMERTFGLKPDALSEDASGLKEARYRIGQTLLRIREPDPDSQRSRFLEEHGPGVYHIAWGVDNIPQLAKELKDKGVPLRPKDGAKGYHRSRLDCDAIAIDPQASLGLYFELADGPK